MTKEQIAQRLKAAKIYSVRTEVDALFKSHDALLALCRQIKFPTPALEQQRLDAIEQAQRWEAK